MTQPPPPVVSPAAGSAARWPLIIITMLVGHVVFMLIMVYIAVSDHSFAVEPDYYEKSLQWDETQAARRSSQQLGWQATVTISAVVDVYQNRAIKCLLVDEQAQPVQGAEVEIVAFSHARGSQRHTLSLDPGPHGQYHGQLRVQRAGKWEFRITARRGDDTFLSTQLVTIRPATGASR